jgi:8-oxo-dGTP pyrophosphatase MutT (NUDIX family)
MAGHSFSSRSPSSSLLIPPPLSHSQPTGSLGYGLPKGEISTEESLRDGALREFREETGIQIPSSALLEYMEESGQIQGHGQKTIHIFLYEGTGSETYQGSNLIEEGFRKGLPENCEGRYFEIEEALRVIHRNQKTLLQLYFQNYL